MEDESDIKLEDLAKIVKNGEQVIFNWSEVASVVDVSSFEQNVGPINISSNTTSSVALFGKLFISHLIQLLVIKTNLMMDLKASGFLFFAIKAKWPTWLKGPRENTVLLRSLRNSRSQLEEYQFCIFIIVP